MAGRALRSRPCAAARRAEAPRATAFTASMRGGQRSVQTAVLHVGNDASDPACFLFLDLLVRLKTHLDESWPLPTGVEWVAAKPRRGGGGGPRREEEVEDDEAPMNGLFGVHTIHR